MKARDKIFSQFEHMKLFTQNLLICFKVISVKARAGLDVGIHFTRRVSWYWERYLIVKPKLEEKKRDRKVKQKYTECKPFKCAIRI